MSEEEQTSTTVTAADGHLIQVQVYTPPGQALGVIQILHGLGEHSGRYARFAAAATARGFVVGIHDHRGHGANAGTIGFFADRKGWHTVIGDALLVHEHLRERYPGQPITLLGHSMGSFLAEHFAMLHGARLSALLLSGSGWPSRIEMGVANLLARVVCWRYGARHNSALLDKLGFDDLNKSFRPARTELDWLSRDAAEVDRYIADPLCGGPYTAGLWRDMTGGLFEIGSDNAVSRVPNGLPILIAGGEMDPVGGDEGLGKLAMHYAQTGHTHIKVRIYPDARHEMLNETNRDDVTQEWLDWIHASTVKR